MSLIQPIRHAFASLCRTPGFTLAAILTLALGTGGAIALFSALDGAILRTPPYPHAERLHQVTLELEGRPTSEVSAVAVREQVAATPEVESLGVYTSEWGRPCRLDTPQGRETIPAVWVDAGVFEVLGIPLFLGASFAKEHYDSGEGVILTHQFWRENLGSDPGVVGRSLPLFGQPQPIIGVLKEGFEFPFATGARLVRPLPPLGPEKRGEYRFNAILRLKPGADPRVVAGTFRRLAEAEAKLNPGGFIDDTRPGLAPLGRQMASTAGGGFLLVCCASALLLLLAATNVAALFLNRAARRSGEIAVRISLGASPYHLLRSTLPESLLVATLAGGLGFLLAAQMGDGLRVWLPGGCDLHGLGQSWAHPGVVIFSIGLVLLLGLVLGCMPLVQARNLNVEGTLRASAPQGRSTSKVRDGLVVLQLAMATLLLVGAGLLGRSLWQLTHQGLGFPTHGLQVVDLEIRAMDPKIQPPDGTALARALEARPGLLQVASCGRIPGDWAGDTRFQGGFSMQHGVGPRINASAGHGTLDDSKSMVAFDYVGADYVGALDLKILQGRNFSDSDLLDHRRVCLLDKTAADQFFPEGAIGRHFQVGMETFVNGTNALQIGEPLEVVGVLAPFRALSPRESPSPLILLPSSFLPSTRLIVRGTLSPPALRREVSESLDRIAPAYRVRKVRTLDDLRWEQVLPSRQILGLILPFGALALLLAALGLGSLMGIQVAQRTRELGLRAALGAPPSILLAMVMGRAMVRSLLGVALGLALSLALVRFVQSFLYGIAMTDPTSLAGAVAVLLGASALSALVPGLRASRTQPAEALRSE